jgi:hypothetical protein
MNSFQILDKDNNAISINELDKEVCEIVGNEVDEECYCVLGRREDYESTWDFISKASNWYDTIGRMIAEGKSFQDILSYYADTMKKFIGKTEEDGTVITLEIIYPYHTKLLNSWINKGYTAKQILGKY